MDDEAIHVAHCSAGTCRYADPQCPVAVEPLAVHQDGKTRASRALALLDVPGMRGVQYAVRSVADGWVYALPKILPKALADSRDTRQAAEWHRQQLVGRNESLTDSGLELVRRAVGEWEVVDGD